MENFKNLLAFFVIFMVGISNNAFGGQYMAGGAANQFAQSIITEFTNQTEMRILDPRNDQSPNRDYLDNVVRLLYAKGFTANLSDPNVQLQIAQAVWNAIAPTVHNYAQQPQYISNQQAYKTSVWNKLIALLSELANTTFKDINQSKQAYLGRVPAARPLPSIPQTSRPLPSVPQTTSRPLPAAPSSSADLEQAKQNFYRMIEFKSAMVTNNPFSMFTFQNGLLVVNQDLLKESYATLTINGKIALNNNTKLFIIKNMKDGITNLMQEGFEDYFKTLRLAERDKKRKDIENYIETQITQFVNNQGTTIRSRM